MHFFSLCFFVFLWWEGLKDLDCFVLATEGIESGIEIETEIDSRVLHIHDSRSPETDLELRICVNWHGTPCPYQIIFTEFGSKQRAARRSGTWAQIHSTLVSGAAESAQLSGKLL